MILTLCQLEDLKNNKEEKMKSNKFVALFTCLVFVAAMAGCSQQPKSANSGDAIQQSKSLKDVEAQVKYLVSEANAYISSEKFDEAVTIAKHVLSQLDSNSAEAKSIIEKAQAQIKALAEKKAEEAKAALKKKMESLGQ